MKYFFLLLLLLLFTIQSFGGGNTYYQFFLDTSLQNSNVTISKPLFKNYPPYNYDFNKYISCRNDRGNQNPIILTGMKSDGYLCTQTNLLDLKPNETYGGANTMIVSANGQNLSLIDNNYRYDPWDNSTYNAAIVYLFYLDKNGILNFREI